MDFMLFATGNNQWTITKFLNNLHTSMGGWGKTLIMIFGTAMVIGAGYHIAKGLMSQGKGQTNWVMVLLLLFVGGVMMATTGWGMLEKMAGGFKDSMDALGTGSGNSAVSPFILPFWIN